MRCPDCDGPLPADGSCCDFCGWTLRADGVRRMSGRSITDVLDEMRRRGTFDEWKQTDSRTAREVDDPPPSTQRSAS